METSEMQKIPSPPGTQLPESLNDLRKRRLHFFCKQPLSDNCVELQDVLKR